MQDDDAFDVRELLDQPHARIGSEDEDPGRETVGDDGAWSCQVTLWNSDLAVGDYTYTATGLTSGATESSTFSDSVTLSARSLPQKLAALMLTFRTRGIVSSRRCRSSAIR